MILSNTAIWEAFADGRLSITPEPKPRTVPENSAEKAAYDTTAVDLHLDNFYSKPIDLEGLRIDLAAPAIPLLRQLTVEEPFPADGLTLPPNKFILSQTIEVVHLKLPDELEGEAAQKPILAARVEGKSSRARFGLLVHFTAPTIHAGFEGPITLEIINLGHWPVVLSAGLAVCQLIVEEVSGKPTPSISQFQDQAHPSGAR